MSYYLGRASSHLGLRFAEAAAAAVRAWGQPMARVDLIASHGQTVHHDPPFSTTQIGEPAVIAEYTGVTTASGFRAADIAAGGQGAPLTSIYDCMMLRPAAGLRALQNIGGISNVTLVPALGDADTPDTPVAFDTGPGNCWIDQAAGMHAPGVLFDRNGAIAGSGTVCAPLLADMLADIGFFAKPIPKSTGRELFSAAALRGWLARAPAALPTQDFVATVTQLTAVTLARGYLLHPPAAQGLTEVVLSGGGAKNPVLVAAIRCALATEFGRAIEVRTLADLDEVAAHACAPGALPEGACPCPLRLLHSRGLCWLRCALGPPNHHPSTHPPHPLPTTHCPRSGAPTAARSLPNHPPVVAHCAGALQSGLSLMGARHLSALQFP